MTQRSQRVDKPASTGGGAYDDCDDDNNALIGGNDSGGVREGWQWNIKQQHHKTSTSEVLLNVPLARTITKAIVMYPLVPNIHFKLARTSQ